jgi:hypothetical protein
VIGIRKMGTFFPVRHLLPAPTVWRVSQTGKETNMQNQQQKDGQAQNQKQSPGLSGGADKDPAGKQGYKASGSQQDPKNPEKDKSEDR